MSEDRGARRPRGRKPRRKVCAFCVDKIEYIDYKEFRDVNSRMRRNINERGLVTFGSAIPIILGAHIGTAFTPLLTIGGSSKDGKRAALIHLYFNIIGSFVLLAAIYAVRYTIGIPVWGDVMNKSTIANIHTLSSVAAMLLFLPFSSVLSKLAMLTVPNSAEEAQEMSMPVLDERLFKSPAVALQQAKSAVVTGPPPLGMLAPFLRCAWRPLPWKMRWSCRRTTAARDSTA